MPKAARVFDIAFTVFVYLLAAGILISAIFFAFNTSPDKALFGIRYYTVLSPSMEPTYHAGDMIFVKLTDAKDIKEDDVITFNPDPNDTGTYLTHRVVKKIENYENTGKICFITKGDNNKSEDPDVKSEDQVIGVVQFGIPILGDVVNFVKLRWYIIVPVLIMIAVFFQLLKRYFILGKEEEEDDKKAQPAAADGPVPENNSTVSNAESEASESEGKSEPEKAEDEPTSEKADDEPEKDESEP